MEYRDRYFDLLKKSFPTIEACRSEIINLEAILSLPKGTEHFLSDLHGEYEAFKHILNNCSGVIREKVDSLFIDMNEEEKKNLCTLIYYPEEKLALDKHNGLVNKEWYLNTLINLVNLTSFISSKYTRSKVKRSISEGYKFIIDELLHTKDNSENNIRDYYANILNAIIDTGGADEYIIEFASLIKNLAVDHLHVVGDIYDRGSKPDYIIDLLKNHHSFDLQWGNHDVLWIGASVGIPGCVLTVLYNNLRYGNNRLLENAYGISIRHLVDYANSKFENTKNVMDPVLKTVLMLLFKLEAEVIKRNPDFDMNSRVVLNNIDPITFKYKLDDKEYDLIDSNLGLDYDNPYLITEEEQIIIKELCKSFKRSLRLKEHIKFIVEKGSVYKCFNGNLLFHGCIPFNENGTFKDVYVIDGYYHGKELLDRINQLIIKVSKGKATEQELDYIYYLWGGYDSPFTGRLYKTFEVNFVKDKEAQTEPRNPYYEYRNSVNKCKMILTEFGLNPKYGHIINGHLPVKAKLGENPVFANGKLIVIDGGLCKAYHKRTGIAGYTLISSSRVFRIKAHEEFSSKVDVVNNNNDILSDQKVIEYFETRIRVRDCDNGKKLLKEVEDLKELLKIYESEAKSY